MFEAKSKLKLTQIDYYSIYVDINVRHDEKHSLAFPGVLELVP